MRKPDRDRTGGAVRSGRGFGIVTIVLGVVVTLGMLAVATEAAALSVALQDTAHYDPEIDPRARQVPHDNDVFKADPTYDQGYDFQAQLDIYGAKHMNPTQRPLLELGRDLYDRGPFSEAPTPLGAYNVLIPQLMVYGDFRTAGAFNDVGVPDVGGIGTAAGRLNLEVDLRLTATERIHAFFRPLDTDGQFTRFDFTGDDTGFKDNFDATPDALFFEGDLGAIVGGLTRQDAPFDLPIAAGLMPLLFHNGIWVEDAFTGAAFTIPSRNSRALDWSNFDITFFAGFDRVSNPAFGLEDGRGLFGTNWFIEAYEGYIEAGYAYVMGPGDVVEDDELDLDLPVAEDFHSIALSFTKRYGGFLSNSVRYIGSVGGGEVGADGHLLLLENSLITSRPSTFVPYFNFFFALGNPVPAAKDPGAGGILKNTGLNFESDGLTGFPTLFAATNDVMGGAVGLNMLASDIVSGQVVLELAATVPHSVPDEPVAGIDVPGPQFGAGVRLQKPLTNALILRADGMFGFRTDLENVMGGRVEFRYKF